MEREISFMDLMFFLERHLEVQHLVQGSKGHNLPVSHLLNIISSLSLAAVYRLIIKHPHQEKVASHWPLRLSFGGRCVLMSLSSSRRSTDGHWVKPV